ncbi:MAG: DUF6468 domain-containing protein [Hyphomonas sp.]
MNIQPTDIAILLISAAACIYCIVLNRRLKALQDTKDGLGATIVAFSKSVSDMSQSTQQTRTHAGQIAGRLADLLSEANAASDRLQSLSRDFDSEHSSLIEKATTEGKQVCERIEKLTRDLDAHACDRFDEMVKSADSEYARIRSQFEALKTEHADRYDDALAQAETSCDWIDAKIEEAEKRLSETLDSIKSSQDGFDAEMRSVFTQCAKQVADMTTLATQVRSLTDRSKFNIEEALQRSEKSVLFSS